MPKLNDSTSERSVHARLIRANKPPCVTSCLLQAGLDWHMLVLCMCSWEKNSSASGAAAVSCFHLFSDGAVCPRPTIQIHIHQMAIQKELF